LGLGRQELVALLSERTQLLREVSGLRQLRRREYATERLRQGDARLQEVCLDARQMLLSRLEGSVVQALRIQQHILQLLPCGAHLLPEGLHRRPVGAERVLDLGFLVIGQVEGMEQLPAQGQTVSMHTATGLGDSRHTPARGYEQSNP